MVPEPRRRDRDRRTVARSVALVAVAALACASALHAGPRWELEARLGGAWNVPLPIVIRQDGSPDLRLTAHWRSESFRRPVYYSWRIARWHDDEGWALTVTHHKLYLEDPPPEVTNLSMSHGFNLVTIDRIFEHRGWRYGGGLGTVVTHPESEVRGRRFDEAGGPFGGGYYISGPASDLLVGRTAGWGRRLFATAEARLTLSFVRVPIAGGSARIPNLALHATVGLGGAVTP